MGLAAYLSPLLGTLLLSAIIHVMIASIQSGDFSRQSVLGLRTKATLSSDQAWITGHRAALPMLKTVAWAGYIGAALLVILFVFFPQPRPYALITGPVILLICQAIALVYAARQASRAARSAN